MKKIVSLICALALLLALPAAPAEGADAAVPELDAPEARELPDSAATIFMRRMGVGWNLGNTFDAWRDGVSGDGLELETYWCGVRTTEEMIEAVRAAGFSTLRVPVSWHNHVDADFTISAAWLDRVQQVVDWAIDRDLVVILNIHHDEDPEFYYPSEACLEVSERYVRRVWEQLAERFAGYGEQLVFESMNEPRLKGTGVEWRLDEGDPRCREAAACVNRLNQLFVDTVRAAGGGNADRYLMAPGYDASAQGALSGLFELPRDPVDGRLIVSVHAYTPYAFALQEGGARQFFMGPGPQTREITAFMDALYDRYVAAGVPVVIGEFGARDRDGNTQARADYAAFFAASARSRGIPCCWWDNGNLSGDYERFALLDRASCAWAYPAIVEALVRYGG